MAPTLRVFRNPSASAVALETPGEAGKLVFRVLDGGQGDADFLARRARRAVESLPDGPDRRHLGRVLRGMDGDADATDRVGSLVTWAGHLESRGLFDWAAEVLERAREIRHDDPELLLHCARIARKAGDRARARACYDRVSELDGGSGHLARLAAVGHALLADDSGRALSRAIRLGVRADDHEAAAVAQEARARLRAERGDRKGAVRDFACAAVRYADPVDAGRIGHDVADLLSAAGDVLGARRVLLAVERAGHPDQVSRARGRLLSISRVLGDQVGLRRWADATAPSLVSLVPRRRSGSGAASMSPTLDRLLRRLSSLA